MQLLKTVRNWISKSMKSSNTLIETESNIVNWNDDSLSRNETVFSCIRILCETVASNSAIVYERLDSGKQRAKDHPLYDILHSKPNGYQTAYQFFYTLTHNLLTHGEFFAFVDRNEMGDVTSIRPFPSGALKAVVHDGRKWFVQSRDVIYPDTHVLHVLEYTDNGINGISPLEQMRRVIQSSNETATFTHEFFRNGMFPGGTLRPSEKVDEEDKAFIREQIEQMHRGSKKTGRLFVEPFGIEYKPLPSLNLKEADISSIQNFQRTTIAAAFRVPSHMVGDLSRSTFSNIEQEGLNFLQSLRPRFVNIEQAINTQLFTPFERKDFFLEFLIDSMKRVDLDARQKYYSAAIQSGWMTANEIRERENLNALAGGDKLRFPLNTSADDSETDIGVRSLSPAPAVPRIQAVQRAQGELRQAISTTAASPIADALGRILRREKIDVVKLLNRHSQSEDQLRELIDFYKTDHRDFTQKQLTPSLRGLVKGVAEDIARELNQVVDINNDAWLDEFSKELSIRVTEERLTKVAAVVVEKPEDLISKISEAFDAEFDLLDGDASDIAVAANGKYSVDSYVVAGYTPSQITWRTNPGACKFCQTLHKSEMDLQSRSYVPKGRTILGELEIKKSVYHPPLHKGCKCSIGVA